MPTLRLMVDGRHGWTMAVQEPVAVVRGGDPGRVPIQLPNMVAKNAKDRCM